MGAGLTLSDAPIESDDEAALGQASATRLRGLVDEHHDFVWRSLRRLSVPVGDVDDAAQRVFLTVARKLGTIRQGSEKAFLFQTALRVASESRRARVRRREAASDEDAPDSSPVGEELLDLRRARRALDDVLDAMPMELRAVFVLFELQGLTMSEIAELLEVPPGTVASRLRRARAQFREKAACYAALKPQEGGGR
jgi:RNA polymerase sigma-70 factor (ECF subfamily)